MQEAQCRAYQVQYGRRYFCVVPTNIYGPHDNFNLENAHVIPALIHRCLLASLHNQDFVVSGDGSSLRQFIFSKDVAKLVLWAYINYKTITHPLILCPPESELSIAQVVRCITDAIEFRGKVVFDIGKPNGQYKKTSDTLDLEGMKHGIEFTSLDDGMKETVDWFIQAYKNKTVRI
jgi:GDP-L-fucose synthase